jgi:TRAP-type mannitol/chloroaromatic compound transport system permease small subunit
MRQFFTVVDSANEWTGKIAAYAGLIILILMNIEVITRFALQMPLQGIHEVVVQFWGFYMVIGGGYVLLKKGHIVIDLLYGRWSPRIQAIADLGTSLFGFLFLGALLWFSWRGALDSIRAREMFYSALPLPIYYLKTILVVAVFLFLLQLIVTTIRNIQYLTASGDR